MDRSVELLEQFVDLALLLAAARFEFRLPQTFRFPFALLLEVGFVPLTQHHSCSPQPHDERADAVLHAPVLTVGPRL